MATTTQDAPDYTLLSDVNVVGSVTLNVSVVGTANVNIINPSIDVYVKNTTLNVNAEITNTPLNVNATITECPITLNVNVQNTQIDVNITNATLNVNITNQVVQTTLPKPCLSLDGVDDRIIVPHNDLLNVAPGNQITIIVWAYLTGWQPGYSVGVLIDKRTERTANYNWEFTASIIQYRIHANNALYIVSIPHSLNTLNCYAMVLNGSWLGGYLNGVLRSSRNDVPATQGNTVNLHIGESIGRSCRIRGKIYQVLIYNRALSDVEIKYNYDNPESPITYGLVLWLKMSEGTGTTVYDYSGYGNNGTIYGATWVSSVGSAPAAINVNITASQVTFNVNVVNTSLNVNATIIDSVVNVNVVIKDATVDLKIYTPSGRWVVASDLLPKLTERQAKTLPANTETPIRDITGRGRLRTLSFLVYDVGAAFDIANDIRIRIYVDGSLRFEISLIGVDGFSGYPADYLRQALIHAIGTGAPIPFNTARFATSPDRYIIMPPHVSPIGGLTMAVWDVVNSRYRIMAGYINLAIEFASSLSIRIHNRNTSYSAYAVVSYEIGEYP